MNLLYEIEKYHLFLFCRHFDFASFSNYPNSLREREIYVNFVGNLLGKWSEITWTMCAMLSNGSRLNHIGNRLPQPVGQCRFGF